MAPLQNRSQGGAVVAVTASRGIRARRSDAGIVRPTRRDVAVLQWLGEQFGAPLSVVGELYGVGERAARRNAERLERAGFASRLTVAGRQWVVPTRAGLRFADLDYETWQPRAWKLEHVEGVGRLRLHLGRLYPDAAWTSERQIRSRWAGSGARVRYADGQLDLADGRCVGVELEVHRKKRFEYEGIGQDVDPQFDDIWWFCRPQDAGWLADVLEEIPTPERPAHHVLALTGELAGVLS
jgi:hypothetical protein